jgi:phage/plasmid-associated DNA primase
MTKKDFTIGTLKYFASIDSPERYKEFKKEQATKHIQESLNGSHNDVARALYEEYGDTFVCASITGKIWFQFRSNKWEQIEDGIFLRAKISGDFVDRYTIIGKELLSSLAACTDKGNEAMCNARLKQAQKMISNLKSAPYKSNVMKECQEVFYDQRFRDKLDTNPTLFPFKNGIYDLTINNFRPCTPEDFISKTAPIDYIEFDEDDERVLNVYEFLEKVFPDKSIRDYFMDTSSDIFLGGNHQKHVYFWTG